MLSVAQRWAIVIIGIPLGFCLGYLANHFSFPWDSSQKATANDEGETPRVELNRILTNGSSDIPALHEMDERIERYLKRWEIRGASIAVSKGDSLVYAKGYGWADEERQERMTPQHLLRVASVSKLLTAAGIMKLVDVGKLQLHARVFGPKGLLNDTAYTNVVKDKRIFDITVEQLLRHQAGFNNAAGDPMFSTRFIMMQNRLTSAPDNRQLIPIILRRRLGYTPGQGSKYSNFGYMLLSQIIERVTGMPYEDFMQKNLFAPAGCFDMHLARNYYENRRSNETRYYMHNTATPSPEFNNSGRMVVRCYGENDIERLNGAGGWCASAPELCRFVAAIDGRPGVRDVLSKQSVEAMTADLHKEHAFSLGWNTTPSNGPWVRTGTLVGTSALVVVYPDGECWVMITNTSTWRGHAFAKETIGFFDKLRHKYADGFPHRSLWPINTNETHAL